MAEFEKRAKRYPADLTDEEWLFMVACRRFTYRRTPKKSDEGRRTMRLSATLVAFGLIGGVCHAEHPRNTPRTFVTELHGLIFSSPIGTSYCPLPSDWTGSDHGTMVFLEPPRECGGADFPSSSRGFQPTNTPRIDMYYAYWMVEDEPLPPQCNRVDVVRLFGRERSICEDHDDAIIVRTVRARYMADIESQVIITLVTTPERVKGDTATFKRMVESIRTCSSTLHTDRGKNFIVGTGQTCPKGAFF